MPARRQRLHQQPVGFVAPAVGRIVERVLRQQDAHYRRFLSRPSSKARRSGDNDSIVARSTPAAAPGRSEFRYASISPASSPLTKRPVASRDAADSFSYALRLVKSSRSAATHGATSFSGSTGFGSACS